MDALASKSNKASTQLALSLNVKDDATFANFYPGKNEEIVKALKNTVCIGKERIAYLCGMHGHGGSHLLKACCHYAYQHQLTSVYLPLTLLLTLTPNVLNDLESLDVVCIDDLHVIKGHKEWEEAIFHLYNRIDVTGGRIIIVAHALPKAIHLGLPDLVSRLSSGMVYKLKPLTDDEKLSALTMRAHRRGITLSDEVGKYILTHCPRHMGTLFASLDALDKASLAKQRRLTIPFVKEVLQM